MKLQIQQMLVQALTVLQKQGVFEEEQVLTPMIERARDATHGDFASNAAMMFCKQAAMKPRDLAEKIIENLPASDVLESVSIAGPGFINFKLSARAYVHLIPTIMSQVDQYGRSNIGQGKRIQVEFVSANPTGPLHVGHGRGAAYGSVVADLLQAIGFEVDREYYVNDAGRQMDILATSVWLRYLELADETLIFPANGYRGDYVWDIAATLHRENQNKYHFSTAVVFNDIPADEPDGGDKEKHIDALIHRAKDLLGEEAYAIVFDLALKVILDDIKNDLSLFGVEYQRWFSEKSLMTSGAVEQCVETLRQADYIYEKSGALWFKSTEFGDEKDRVVVRDNGQPTYFASDIAYHMQKLERGYDRIIDVWGADHHGYVPRVKGALKAIGVDEKKLDVLLVQFAVLYRSGEKVAMSTRSGQFVTLRELRKEVGKDAARFFYVMRKCEQHMDFDLDLAKSQSNDNPVYYVQYAHARVCSVFRQAKQRDIDVEVTQGQTNLERLDEPHEQALLKQLSRYPEVIESAALNEEPHQLTYYLRELANDFHSYYNKSKFLVDDKPLRDARIKLIQAIRIVLKNGLDLIGVSAPEEM